MKSFKAFLEELKANEKRINLEKVVVSLKENSWTLFFDLKSALPYEEFHLFYKNLKEFFSTENKIKVDFNFHFQEQNPEYLENYYSFILEQILDSVPRLNFIQTFRHEFKGNHLNYFIDEESTFLEKKFKDTIKNIFMKYGFMIQVIFIVDQSVQTTSAFIEETKKNGEIAYLNDVKLYEERKNYEKNDSKVIASKTKKQYRQELVAKINQIPVTQFDLENYQNTVAFPQFQIEGEIFHVEVKELRNTTLLYIKFSDDTDSIVVKKFLRKSEEIDEAKTLRVGDIIKVSGRATYDTFERDVCIMSDRLTKIDKTEKNIRKDTALTKRVELHTHTKMSNLDGIVEANDFIDRALLYGHKAMAFTDHNGVYAFPDINKKCGKIDFKPIYGCEFEFIAKEDVGIALQPSDINLKEAIYCVFDLETTGFTVEFDEIIEIACIKYQGLNEIGRFNELIKVDRTLHPRIVEVTNITDEMLQRDGKKFRDVMNQFIHFIDGSILVGHNVNFDLGHLYKAFDNLKISYDLFPAIDTLQMAKVLYEADLKRFNLMSLSKFLKVTLENHHRALDDSKACGDCLLLMLDVMSKKGITLHKDMNSLVSDDQMYRYLKTNHLTVLVKNKVGLKNLYKLLSHALTKSFHKVPIITKKTLQEFREGLLIGSSCFKGLVFENAMYKSFEELEKEIDYYDYIELQPKECYTQIKDDLTTDFDLVIGKIIDKIIRAAEGKNKWIVATGDVHYLDKEEQEYRDIYINTPTVGKGTHDLFYATEKPLNYFRTTDQMLSEFMYLGQEKAFQYVCENTNKIADLIEKFPLFPKDLYSPQDDYFKEIGVESIEEDLLHMVYQKAHELYGEELPLIIKDRLEKELNSIITNKFSPVYYMSALLVKKSLRDGYLVGSRGSVGSSLVATMMEITEVNPMPPHYRCPKCKFSTFKLNLDDQKKYPIKDIEKSFIPYLAKVESGFDLEILKCPVCGEILKKDGHDIPFETFLGFDGDKVPDIDLNFSGDYQSTAHEYVRELMGVDNAYRSGTISTVAEKTAFGYVKGYLEKKSIAMRNAQIEKIAKKIEGTKRSTGQHPGGIIVVPNNVEIYDITPIQYPADDLSNSWRTTHFDYHSFEANLLKLDILGHDDPTVIKFLMDYVKEHPDDFPFTHPQEIPVDDKNVYKLFKSTEIINVSKDDILSEVASYAVPELGTNFVRNMLVETKPDSFGLLVKISGLSHGTDVWANNAQDLINNSHPEFGKVTFDEVIGCRDDIMVYLQYQGLPPKKAFEIMEFVRKGNVGKNPEKWKEFRAILEEYKIKPWYIWSCEQIKYMFPKAHATAYVLSAMRIAWFKVYRPLLFYSAFFTIRAVQFDMETMCDGKNAVYNKIQEINSLKKGFTTDSSNDEDSDDDDKGKKFNAQSKTTEELLNTLQVSLEMLSRGYTFKMVDMNKSAAGTFLIEGDSLLMPFKAVNGMGMSVCSDIVEKRIEKPFTSKKEIKERTKINKTIFEYLDKLKVFKDFTEKEEIKEAIADGIFGLGE